MTEDLFDCEVESGLSQLLGKALMQRLINIGAMKCFDI